MAQTTLGDVLRYLWGAWAAQDARDLTDGQLLERFLTDGDENAFAVLAQRHGPLVLGVCRRLAGDWHSAEDMYEATFLVLIRRAASSRK